MLIMRLPQREGSVAGAFLWMINKESKKPVVEGL